MALSYITREADGVQSQFDFPFGYLSKSHVFMFVDNSLVAFKWISDFLVEPLVRPLAGSSVTIRRLTDRANRVTTYTDGQTLLASSLNAGDLQTFFIAQEMIDQIEEGIVTGDVSVINPGTGYITAQWIQDQLQAGLAGAPQFDAVQDALDAEAIARANAIAAEALARANAIAAEALARADAITAETDARVASVTAEAAARAAQVLALTAADADQVDRLVVIEQDLNTPTTGVKAKLVFVEDLVVTETSARASADAALSAEINDPTTGLKARATSLESRTTAVETGKASAAALDALEAIVEDPTTGLATRASQTSVSNLTTTVDGKADASRVTALETSVNNPTTGLSTRASQQSVTDLSSTVAGKASASDLDALEAVVNNPTTGLSTRASQADFVSLSSEVDGKADASRVTALEASVNNPTTGLSTRASQQSVTDLATVVNGKASASALDALEAVVEHPTTGLTTRAAQADLSALSVTVGQKADASTVNTLTASVEGVRNDLDAAAWDDAAYFWSWDGAAITGFVTPNGVFAYPATGGLQVSQNGANGDLNLSSPTISYPGSRYTKMVVDVECITPPTAPIVQDERAYWATAGHGYAGSFSDRPRQTMPTVAGERKLLVYDFDTAEFGAADYLGNTITRLRFDFPQGLGSVYLVRSVKIVAPATLGALSRINSVEADITTANTAIADLTANKASASSVTALTATVDTIKMDDANIRPANRIGFITPVNGTPVTQAQTTVGTVVASPNEGQVLQVTGGANLSHRNYLPIIQGRTYRVRARVAATVDGTDMRLNVGARWYTADFQDLSVNSGFIDTTFTVAKGWRTVEYVVTAASILAANPTAAYLTSRLFIGYNASGTSAGGTWQIAWSDIADITDLQNTAEIAAASSALNKNPFFAEGSPDTGVLPRGWNNWSNGIANTVIEPRPWGGGGLHARVTAVNGGVGVGWQQVLAQGSVRAGNKYLVRADVALVTGTYQASGVLVQWFNASNGLIATQWLSFFTERDTSGVLATTGDGRRVFEKTFTAPANATRLNIYAMTQWNGFGQAYQNPSPTLRWFECSIHQINSSTAGVTELREALATGSSSQARLLLSVNTATNVATIEAFSSEGDGVWNGSKIAFTADTIELNGNVLVNGTVLEDKIAANAISQVVVDQDDEFIDLTNNEWTDIAVVGITVPAGSKVLLTGTAFHDAKHVGGLPTPPGHPEVFLRIVRKPQFPGPQDTVLRTQNCSNNSKPANTSLTASQGTTAISVADLSAPPGDWIYVLQGLIKLSYTGTPSSITRRFYDRFISASLFKK